ncbi:MAG: ACP S-malonyltransferase [Eubacteriales bacterium]|nr:ACP S-malonyltransferase [Eubacteriales bacterium]
MSRIAFIYPGQGAQHIGMGKEFFDAYECVRARFSEASELLSLDLAKLMFEENDKLDDTRYTQPAMVLMELALTEVIKQETGLTPAYSAGLSLGEYAAVSEAGVLSFADAVKTVAVRGRLMADAVPSGGAMTAVLGADAALIEEVISPIDGASIANYNCPGQIVITGMKDAVDKAAEALSAAGVKKCIPLNVSGPFHSPFLKQAGEELFEELQKIQISAPVHPYIANVTAEAVTDPAVIRELLRDQVSSSVRWQQSVEKLLSEDVDTFVEIGPGKTLSGFMRKILKPYAQRTGRDVSGVKTYTTETPADLEQLKEII